MIRKQQGYLIFVAVLLVVLIGFLGVAVSSMFFSSAFSMSTFAEGGNALYIAEGGLEKATRYLLTPSVSGTTTRISCAAVTGNANLTDSSLDNGTFTVTAVGGAPVFSSDTLSSAVTASATTIPVTSTSGFSASGRIMIDREMINYAGISGNNFVRATRGVDGSLASSHATAAPVAQYQCNLDSKGGLPNLTSPINQREVQQAVQLQEGWVVGNSLAGPNWNTIHWNRPTEMQWVAQVPGVATPQNLRAVSVVSSVDAWVAGVNASVLHYNGSTWTKISTGLTAADDFTGISAVSSQEAWTCSSQGRIYKWSGGASWTTSIATGRVLNAISMIDTSGNGTANAGIAVADARHAFIYNGTSWSEVSTGITVNLNGVSILSATNGWAAGDNGTIYQWNGASWAVVTTPSSSPNINAISMIKSGSSDIGWAVGTASTAWFYNGTSWASSNTGLAGGLTINGVVTVSPNEAWLVDNSFHIYEWNGSTWTLVLTSTKALTAIDVYHPNRQPQSMWQEIFS